MSEPHYSVDFNELNDDETTSLQSLTAQLKFENKLLSLMTKVDDK